MLFRKLAFLVAIAGVVSAQEQESPRFAFISPQYLIQNSAQGMRVFAEAQATEKRLDETIRVKREELQKLDQQRSSSSINEEGRNRLNKQFEEGVAEYQQLVEEAQAEKQRVTQAAEELFFTEVMPIIEALANERKLQSVINLLPGLVVWGNESVLLEFTKEVAKRYDAAYPSGKPATTTPSTPKSASPNSSK
ncbi:MAG: OmpH family outer membrane protein [Holophagaceae bacterium]|nr:OmpH family outer membrane protein [Holophagaceae bacterium]